MTVAIACAAAAPGAAAEPAPSEAPARLELEAPGGCGTRAELAARVALRSARIRFAAGSGAGGGEGASLRVRIALAADATFTADLTVGREPGGHRSVRHVSGATCDEALDALALMITILLDPSAHVDAAAATGPAAPSASPRAGPVGAPAVAAPIAAAPPVAAGAAPSAARAPARDPSAEAAPAAAVSAPAAAAHTPDSVVSRTPPAPPPAAPPPGPAVRRFGAVASARGVTGPAPRAMLGLALGVSVAFDRESIWSFAARLGAAHQTLSGWAAPGGTADFALDTLELELCPARLAAGRLEARACAAGTAGRFSARGSQTYAPASSSRPFATAGGALVLGIELGARLEVEATAGAAAALVRDAFQFAPDVFHRVSPLAVTAALGLGFRLP